MTNSAMARFESKIERVPFSGCWLWIGALNADGYGRFGVGGRNRHAHRVAYEALVGPIPAGKEIDHLCSVRACVNPAHLEPVAHAENVRRGRVDYRAGWTSCPRGHAFTPENTYVIPKSGHRRCRACANWRSRLYNRGLQVD